jgi:hypothetical protein
MMHAKFVKRRMNYSSRKGRDAQKCTCPMPNKLHNNQPFHAVEGKCIFLQGEGTFCNELCHSHPLHGGCCVYASKNPTMKEKLEGEPHNEILEGRRKEAKETLNA